MCQELTEFAQISIGLKIILEHVMASVIREISDHWNFLENPTSENRLLFVDIRSRNIHIPAQSQQKFHIY